MARVFSAVDIEQERLLDELADVRDRLNLGFKPVPREKMHITLQFFRDIDEEEISEIRKAMDGVEIEPFRVRIQGLGCFPSTDYIRVVWAGVRNRENLDEVYRQVSDNPVRDDNSHEFKPHVTLIRVENIRKEQKKKLRRTIREFENHGFGNLEVKNLKLFRSDLRGGGSVYSKLYEKEL